jgi:hypothetical protein
VAGCGRLRRGAKETSVKGPLVPALSRILLAALLLAGPATIAAGAAAAAELDEACRAQPVGDARLMKSHKSSLGRCLETDRGDDPYRFGRTGYRKQAIGWRDRRITLADGGAAIEEYVCRPPIGILMQVYRCPCGIETAVPGRGVCRSTKPPSTRSKPPKRK